MEENRIQVLVVDDSPAVREMLVHILSSDPSIDVVATASNGKEAIELSSRYRPHVITMDVTMPVIDGLEATKRIMETAPVPIVIVSASYHPDDVDGSFKALDAGAIAVAAKPEGIGTKRFEEASKKLVQMVKLMSEIKVVRRRRKNVDHTVPAETTRRSPAPSPDATPRLIAIGTSTGGPLTIEQILSNLRPDFPIPILLVQHIAVGFIEGFVDWLNTKSKVRVVLAHHGMTIDRGYCYVAPDSKQMKVDKNGTILLTDDEPEASLRPSVSYLFRSVAESFGDQAIGILLTGMGRDGAAELKTMKARGAITIAQDKESSVVHGMPGEAIKLDAASLVLSTAEIAEFLNTL